MCTCCAWMKEPLRQPGQTGGSVAVGSEVGSGQRLPVVPWGEWRSPVLGARVLASRRPGAESGLCCAPAAHPRAAPWPARASAPRLESRLEDHPASQAACCEGELRLRGPRACSQRPPSLACVLRELGAWCPAQSPGPSSTSWVMTEAPSQARKPPPPRACQKASQNRMSECAPRPREHEAQSGDWPADAGCFLPR